MIEEEGKENATTTTNNIMRAIEDEKNICISQIEDLRDEQAVLRTQIERKQEKIIQLQKDFNEMKLDNKKITEEEKEIKHQVKRLETEIIVLTNNLSQVSENTDLVLVQFHELRVHIENESKMPQDNTYNNAVINDTQTLDNGMMEKTSKDIHEINKERVKKEKSQNSQEDVRKYDEQQRSAYEELDNRIKESNELFKTYHESDKTLHATSHQHLIDLKQTLQNKGKHYEELRDQKQNNQENNQSAEDRTILINEIKTQFNELKEVIENDMTIRHKQYKETTNINKSSLAEERVSYAKTVDDDRNYHDQQRNELRQLRQAVEGSIKIHEAEGENNRKAHDIQLEEFHDLKNIVEIRMKNIQNRHTEEEGDDHYPLKYINQIKEHMNEFEQLIKDDKLSHECQIQEFRELRQLLDNDRSVNKVLGGEKEEDNGEWKDEMKAIKTAIESDIKMHEEHRKLFDQYQKSQEQELHELKKAVVNSQANKVHKAAKPGEHTDIFVDAISHIDQLKEVLSNNSESQNKQIKDLEVLKNTIEIDMKLREEQREYDRTVLNENMNGIKHKLGSILAACDKQNVSPTTEQSIDRQDNSDDGNQGEIIRYHFNILKEMIEKDMLLQDERREAERIHNEKQQMETQRLVTILENDRELRAEQRQDFLNLKENLDSNTKFQEQQVEVQKSYHNNLKVLEKTFERYAALQVNTSGPDDSKQHGYISNNIPGSLSSQFEDQSIDRRIKDQQLHDGNGIQEQLQNTLQKLNVNIGDNIQHLKDLNDRQETLHGIELNEFKEIKKKMDVSNKYQETQGQSIQEMIGQMEKGNNQLENSLLVDRNFHKEQRENDRKYYTELRQSEKRVIENQYEDYRRSQQELKNVSMELHTETRKSLTSRITAVLDVCQETSELVNRLDKRPLGAIKQGEITADNGLVVYDYVERIDNHFYELKHTMDKDRKRQEKQHDEKSKFKLEQREHKKKIKEKHREEDRKSKEELRKQENQLRENQIEEMQILRLTVENDKRIQGKQQEETTRLIKKNNKDVLDLKQVIDDERQLLERQRRETRLSKDESKENDRKQIEKLCDDTYIVKNQFQELNEVFTRDRKLYERQREEDILYRVEQRDHQKKIQEKQREEFHLLKEELAKGRKYQENQREDIDKMRTRFEELKQTIEWDRNFQDKQRDNERKNVDEQRQIDRRLYYQQKEQFQELMKSVENDRKINKENVQEMNGNISQIIKAVKKPKSLSKPEKKSKIPEKEVRIKKRKTTEKVLLQRRRGIEVVVLPKIPSNITSRQREDLHKETTKKKTTKTFKKKKKKKKLIIL
ncbi:Hypothetical predicted protein [Mytilus galloprovincialis]|uniref:Uncharacterized protein n=1 Tax=Mytilus galloprovincialis TaxID=29158 RepID=A0A8B6BIB5_MYTGA|nr:Hypothetical predicted protein [Mytilus galloprovincialis]